MTYLMRSCLLVWIVLGNCLIALADTKTHLESVSDARQHLPDQWKWDYDSQEPVCGIYSMVRALLIVGIEVNPLSLWNSEVVGNPEGSSPAELKAAIEKQGGTAHVSSSMTILELEAIGGPVIANVRNKAVDAQYKHWVCVDWTPDGLAVYDGANGPQVVCEAEFMASWSGVGILVGKDSSPMFWLYIARIAANVALIGVAFLTLRGLKPRQERKAMTQIVLILISAVLVTLSGAVLFKSASGYQVGIKDALEPHVELASSVMGGMTKITEAIESPDHLLIDARTESSFRLGSLERAVNIPVNVPYDQIESFVEYVPRKTPIVVFCQSQACQYDEFVASSLLRLGFTNVVVTQPGYAEYTAEVEPKSGAQ